MVTPLAKTAAAAVCSPPPVAAEPCAPPGRVPSTTSGTNPPSGPARRGPVRPGRDGRWPGSTPPSRPRRKARDPDAQLPRASGSATAIRLHQSRHRHRADLGSGQADRASSCMHIHSVGKVRANSVAPTGGAPGDFLSAGGHFNAPGHRRGRGDEQPVAARCRCSPWFGHDGDHHRRLHRGTADLRAETAIVIHEKTDNFAEDRYTQSNGARDRTRPPCRPATPVSAWRAGVISGG